SFLTRVGRGLIGRVYELVRRAGFSPFTSMDQKLSLVLREGSVRAGGLSAQNDESLLTVSQKLDTYVSELNARHQGLHDEIAAQRALIEEARTSAGQIVSVQLDRQAEALKRESEALRLSLEEIAKRMDAFRQDFDGMTIRVDSLQREQRQMTALVGD